MNQKTGQVAGVLRNIIGTKGIALMRLENLSKTDLVLVSDDDDENKKCSVNFKIPQYFHLDSNLIEILNKKNLI
jgi:hypothetical protein